MFATALGDGEQGSVALGPAALTPYVGIAYGTYEDKARAIGGLNIYFPASVSSLVIYDGVKVHPTLSWSQDRHTISFLLANGEDTGVSYSVVF